MSTACGRGLQRETAYQRIDRERDEAIRRIDRQRDEAISRIDAQLRKDLRRGAFQYGFVMLWALATLVAAAVASTSNSPTAGALSIIFCAVFLISSVAACAAWWREDRRPTDR